MRTLKDIEPEYELATLCTMMKTGNMIEDTLTKHVKEIARRNMYF